MSPLRKNEESSASTSSSSSSPTPPERTPQMMILGMNSNDEDVLTQRSRRRSCETAAAAAAAAPTNRSSSWLSGMISSRSHTHPAAPTLLLPAGRISGTTTSTTSPRDDNERERQQQQHRAHDYEYSAMGDDSPQRLKLKPRRHHRLLPAEITSDMVYAALGPQSPSSGGGAVVLGSRSTSSSTAGVADEQQENFFFRSTDGTTISPRRSSLLDAETNGAVWKTLRRNTRHAELFEYSDAVETLPAPVLQRYRTRYAQLNQEIVLPERDDRHHIASDDAHYRRQYEAQHCIMLAHRDDLQLHDDTHNHHDAMTTAFSTIAQSNLVYEADGKRLMRLPRDRVRLLMDPDLEPGILSVEGNHSQYNGCKNNNDGDGDDDDDSTNRHYHHQQHDVRYVLTIHEDLYRKIVMEMSPRHLQYDAKLDIRFAYLALAIIMLILLINTFAFHES